MNNYVTRTQLLAEMGRAAASEDVDVIDMTGERASREFDGQTHRQFYTTVATRYYAQGADLPDGEEPAHLPLFDDWATLTSVKLDLDGDGTYEVTLVADTDFWTTPENRRSDEPITGLYLDPNGTQVSAWPTRRRAIQVVGKAGYSDTVRATGATTSEAVDLTETAIDISDHTLIEVGMTVRIDDEDMDVTAVTAGTPGTMNVQRAINGTAAATHSNGATISRRVFPADVVGAVAARAAMLYRGEDRGSVDDIGGSRTLGSPAFARFIDVAKAKRRMVVA